MTAPKQIPFLDVDGLPLFLLNVLKLEDHAADIEVLEVDGWTEAKAPEETRLYLRATIKWDGCSHVEFGEIENGKPTGYLHLCGAFYWKRHCEIMQWAFMQTAMLVKDMDQNELLEMQAERQFITNNPRPREH